MELAPIPVISADLARQRCIVRAGRMARVKFVTLPVPMPEPARGETRGPGVALRRLLRSISRVLGRLVAARP
jgi:hypothetical protein